jgi:hypothetical protein
MAFAPIFARYIKSGAFIPHNNGRYGTVDSVWFNSEESRVCGWIRFTGIPGTRFFSYAPDMLIPVFR